MEKKLFEAIKRLSHFDVARAFGGGSHLGHIREWIKWNCYNGERVTWGTDASLQMKLKTVKEMEELATNIAAVTLIENASNIVSDTEKKALEAYSDPKNWSVNSAGEMVFKPDEGRLHYTYSILGIKSGYELTLDPEEFAEKRRKENEGIRT